MPEDAAAKPTLRRGWGMAVLIWSFFLFVLYALSPGPVIALWEDPPPEISDFYAPLEAVYGAVPLVHDFYDWYFTLWGIK